MTGKRALPGYACLLVLAAFCLTWNLGDRLLWGDEASTALLARNVLRFGVPLVDDGRNRITLLEGRDSNAEGIWTNSPWLPEYLVAGSFWLMGETTAAARLPFALLGLASAALLAGVARRVYRDHELALTALFLLVTCVPFLLHARQGRYFAVLMLAQVALVWGFSCALEGRVRAAVATLVLASAAQFYSNYLCVPGNWLAMGMVALALRRQHPQLLRCVVLAFGLLVLVALPWLFYAETAGQLGLGRPRRQLLNLAYYVVRLDRHVLPLVLLLLPLGLALALRTRGRPREAARSPRETSPVAFGVTLLLVALVFCQLFVLSAPPRRYFRYATPLIPVLMLLASVILASQVRPAWPRRALVLLLGLTNLVGVATALPFGERRSPDAPFVGFLRSITTEYTDRLEDVVAYLRREARPDETLHVPDPEFPLMFYTELRIVDARTQPFPERPPDWILPVSPSGVRAPRGAFAAEWLTRYEPVRLEVHASRRGSSRPSPGAHAFFSASERETFLLYRRPRGRSRGGPPGS